MQSTTPQPRPPRAAVLILSHADGHLEAYAARHIDVHLARVPAAFSVEGECQAEQIAEWLLPRRYRELWRADMLRAVGTTRPLLPSVLAEAQTVTAIIDVLVGVTEEITPGHEREEAMAWTL